MFAGDHAIECARERHDALDRAMRGLQHGIVVAVDRYVGVHIAVARVHMQRHPYASLEKALVDGVACTEDGLKGAARKDGAQRFAQLGFPARAQAALLQLRKKCIQVVQPMLPLRAHAGYQLARLQHPVLDQLGRCDGLCLVLLSQRQFLLGEEFVQRVAQCDLVAQAEFDIDTLDAVGVFAHARQRNHHVFIDLESVGVPGNCSGTLAVEPELLARVGTDGDKALAPALVRHPHHFRRSARHRVGVVAGNVAEQDHSGKA